MQITRLQQKKKLPEMAHWQTCKCNNVAMHFFSLSRSFAIGTYLVNIILN